MSDGGPPDGRADKMSAVPLVPAALGPYGRESTSAPAVRAGCRYSRAPVPCGSSVHFDCHKRQSSEDRLQQPILAMADVGLHCADLRPRGSLWTIANPAACDGFGVTGHPGIRAAG